MNIIRFRKPKIYTALSTIDPNIGIPIDAQRANIKGWSNIIPKVMVIGETEPIRANGVRFVKARPTINNLLATYIQSIPGLEGVCLTNPDVELNEDGISGLMKFLEADRMDMTWGCRSGNSFFMSSSVAALLVNELPPNTLFTDQWQAWMNTWMSRMLRQRYVDASNYLLIKTSTPQTAPTMPEEPPKPTSARRKHPVKKIKIHT